MNKILFHQKAFDYRTSMKLVDIRSKIPYDDICYAMKTFDNKCIQIIIKNDKHLFYLKELGMMRAQGLITKIREQYGDKYLVELI